ncbi:MAG: FAD-binding oxidoreductase [Promethearchaeota archaeon]
MVEVQKVYQEIEDVVGSKYVSDKDFMKAAYSRNVDPAFPDRWADIIVRPETAEEISEIVKIANKYKSYIVPRGGGADLVGGAATQGGILLDVTRMNKVIEINEDDFYCFVEVGITWGELNSLLLKKDLTIGIIGPGSGFSATIGGGLSNSTAGFGSTKYGLITDNCLGVEVVLGDPKGTIIRTGSMANQYAKPFCRYGIAPDFTGLFMGDVGTMGIKTKASLKLYPHPPFKIRRNYMLLKNDYNLLFKVMHECQTKIRDGLQDLYVAPLTVVKLLASQAEERPPKRARMKGPVMLIILEATDERILEIYEIMLAEIMKDVARPFEWTELDLKAEKAEDWRFNLEFSYKYFNKFISLAPPKISCTTCHKIPISSMAEKKKNSTEWDNAHRSEFPEQSFSLFATSIHLLSNGHCVFAGGFNCDNDDSQREVAMKMWHKRVAHQAQYGGAHYWLGESISQSIVESGAYTPEFVQFFKNIKRTVDPNYILSPKKFHMYSYEDDITKYIVKEE